MDWIRKNPHLLTLIVVAVAVMGLSALVANNARGFNDKFDSVKNPPPVPVSKIPPVDYTPLDQAHAELQKPAQWQPIKDADKREVYPFVPGLYAIQDNKPQKSGAGTHNKDRLTGIPIPDSWFIQNGLNVTDPTVALQDFDKDGFLAEDEFRANTDPKDAKSHPPYHSKLFFKNIIRIPFRLRFNAYDGDPVKDKPENMTFQINTLDLRQASEFLKIGDPVRNTKFKLESFEYKTVVNAATQSEEEVSVLTVVNTETGEKVPLVKGKVVDSPDIRGTFSYVWPNPHLDFTVRKLGRFALPPEKDQFFSVVDITEDHATLKTASGEEIKIVPMPAGYQP